MSVYGEAPYALDQGYILEEAPVRVPVADGRSLESSMRVVVTSHGCDCDRYERAVVADKAVDKVVVQIAPVHPLAEIGDNGLHNDIRKGRVNRYFHIPPEDGHDELVADLFFEQPMPTKDLMKLVRVAALSEEWCLRLAVQTFALRSHKRIEDLYPEPPAESGDGPVGDNPGATA